MKPMLDGQPTKTISPEDAMQAAVDLVWQPITDPEQFALATSRAQVLVSMARELRLGKNKMRKYTDVERPQAAPPVVPQPQTLELIGSEELRTEPGEQPAFQEPHSATT